MVGSHTTNVARLSNIHYACPVVSKYANRVEETKNDSFKKAIKSFHILERSHI